MYYLTIRELREKNKLSQVALAKSLGVSSNAISAIESGRLKLSERLAAKVKEVYGEAVEQPAGTVLEKKLEKAAANVEKKARTARRKVKAAEEKVEEAVAEKAEKLAEDTAQAVLDTEKKADKKKRAVRTRAKANKPAVEAVAEAVAAPVEAAAIVVEQKAKKARKPRTRTETARKPAEKKASAAKAPKIVIQSPFGGEITEAEILARIGEADAVYVRVDQNKAYWVRGEESGAIDLW